jgi:hypothetical protein
VGSRGELLWPLLVLQPPAPLSTKHVGCVTLPLDRY